MKGQYITIEYVIFFAIGVMIVILVYGMFSDTNKVVEEAVTKTQLESIGSMITGAIVNVFETSNNTNSIVFYNLTIPKRVSNCIYSILITPTKKLRLECLENRKINAELDLYNFNIMVKNILYSTKGFLTISVNGGKVELT